MIVAASAVMRMKVGITHSIAASMMAAVFGDFDYLEGTCLDIFAQAVRAGYRGYQQTGGRGEYAEFDEVLRWDRELYLEVLRDLCWK